jgi:hypothetical protein
VEHKKKQEPTGKDTLWWQRLWRWTGWSEMKLWDWQALLFIPVTIALIASLFTQIQNNRQQDIENLRAERALLEAYLEHIGTLLLEEDLRTAGEDTDVRLLARARTLAALDGVSGDRKVRLLEFLSETKLIRSGSPSEAPVISLRFANLSETRLVKRSILSHTDLDRAELIGANLEKAKLINASLSGADLSGANLSGANLSRAEGVRCQQTQDAKSLEGATMPNEQKYEELLKDRGGCGE